MVVGKIPIARIIRELTEFTFMPGVLGGWNFGLGFIGLDRGFDIDHL